MADQERNTPTLVSVIDNAIAAALEGVYVDFPARVTAYDSAEGTVDVQPVVKRAYLDEDDVRRVETLPQITDVPIAFPGAGGFRLTFPIAVGNTVRIVVSSVSIERWLDTDGTVDVDPADDRVHALEDSIAVPEFRPLRNWVAPPTADAALANDNGVGLFVDDTEVRLGDNTATELAAFASDLTSLKAVFDAWVVVGTDGGGALKTLLAGAGWAPTGATKVKVI